MLDRSFASTETLRLADIHTLDVFYTPLEARFERITRLARRALKVPVAAIALLHEGRQWFKSVDGWNVYELPTEKSFCSWTVARNEMLVVEDTRLDERFREHPLVDGAPGFRFYAGFPLCGHGGLPVGTFSVYDTQPRIMSAGQVQALRDLGEIAQKELLTTELREAQAALVTKLGIARRQASLDELTRIWTRGAGLQLLRASLTQAASDGNAVAVCMADIDHFKSINDQHGHPIGDQVLRKIAGIVVNSLRSSDTVCRYGGDELLLVMEDADLEKLYQITNRICHRVAEFPIKTRSGDAQVTLSIGGILTFPKEGQTIEDLIAKADRALYRAKQEGRNRAVITGDTADADRYSADLFI
jgi:diguanylate cyclase (GGDEF)-like protein